MSPKLLKSVAGKSRIFIRPIQRDLDLEATDGDAAPKKVSVSDYLLWFPVVDVTNSSTVLCTCIFLQLANGMLPKVWLGVGHQ